MVQTISFFNCFLKMRDVGIEQNLCSMGRFHQNSTFFQSRIGGAVLLMYTTMEIQSIGSQYSRISSLMIHDSFHIKRQYAALRQFLHEDSIIPNGFPVPLHAVNVNLLLACSLHPNPQGFPGRKRKLRAVDLRSADEKFPASADGKNPKRVPNKCGR